MTGLPDAASLGFWGLLTTSFVIGLSGALMPGPMLTAAINHAARQGTRVGPLMVAGHGILEGFLVVGLIFGLGAFLARPLVMALVGGAGAVILAWMAWGMFRSLPGLSLDLSPDKAGASGRAVVPLRDGVLLSAANPYFIIWWATVGLSMVTMAMESDLGVAGAFVFYGGHLGADFIWYLLVAFLVANGRRFINDTVYRAMVGVCAAALVLFAGYFGWFAYQQMSA